MAVAGVHPEMRYFGQAQCMRSCQRRGALLNHKFREIDIGDAPGFHETVKFLHYLVAQGLFPFSCFDLFGCFGWYDH